MKDPGRSVAELPRPDAAPDGRAQVQVLGSLRVLVDGGARALGGRRPRTLLATLVARAGTPIGRDDLVGEVWDAPPRTAVDTLYSHLSRLRRALAGGPIAIETRAGGYVADMAPHTVDADRFELLVCRGRAALRSGRGREAADLLRSALALWQGEAYAGVAGGVIVDTEVHRLDELRAVALDDRIDADLACGRVTALLPELDALARDEPLRERRQAQRILALYLADRQADALAAYNEARATLIDELGVEPGPLLRNLQARILLQDPDLRTVAQLVDEQQRSTVVVSAAAGNLPDPLSQPVAVEREAGRLADLTRAHRLVTATGVCGSGKTTLALAAARHVQHELPDGVWLIEPADGADASAVAAEVLDVLRLPPTRDPLAAAVDALRDRSSLLLFDGCDRVPGCAALVDHLLERCRHLRVLATSQHRLRLSYEHRFRVPALRLPEVDAGEEAQLRAGASRLLLDRLRRWSPRFDVDDVSRARLVQVVRGLDGLPLALEIAAEHCEQSGLAQLADVVEHAPETLVGRTTTRGAVRSVASMVDRSLSRLTPAAAELLEDLSVFTSDFTSEAADAVHRHGTISHDPASRHLVDLTDASIVEPTPTATGVARFATRRLLRHTVSSRLTARQRDRLAFRHAAHCSALTEHAGPRVLGPDQVHWLNRLHEEQGNLRQALAWAIEVDETVLAMRIVAGAWRFWSCFGHRNEGYGWARAVLDRQRVDREVPDHLLQPFDHGAGRLALACGDRATARHLLRRSLQVARRQREAVPVAVSLAALVEWALADGAHEHAARLLRRADAAAGRAGDPWTTATVRQVEGMVLLGRRAHATARAAFEAAEHGFRDAGDEWSACLARLEVARIACVRGDVAAAASLHRANLARTIDLTASTFDFVGLPADVRGLAALAARAGHGDLAQSLRATARRVEAPDGRSAGRVASRDLLRHALEETRILSV